MMKLISSSFERELSECLLFLIPPVKDTEALKRSFDHHTGALITLRAVTGVRK